MKLKLAALTLLTSALYSGSALSADLACDVYAKGNGQQLGNGGAHCVAFDFSFGNSTSGRYYLKNVTKPIRQVIWNGHASCNGGTSCAVTVRAYARAQSATATILYQDGTYEVTNKASMEYETGH